MMKGRNEEDEEEVSSIYQGRSEEEKRKKRKKGRKKIDKKERRKRRKEGRKEGRKKGRKEEKVQSPRTLNFLLLNGKQNKF